MPQTTASSSRSSGSKSKLVVAFLQARSAQNLSLMRTAENGLRVLAEVQGKAGRPAEPLVRLTRAQADVVRDTAAVYSAFTKFVLWPWTARARRSS
jgi:hypothetical protein